MKEVRDTHEIFWDGTPPSQWQRPVGPIFEGTQRTPTSEGRGLCVALAMAFIFWGFWAVVIRLVLW